MANLTSISNILDNAFKSAGISKKIKEYSFFPEWDSLVASDISSLARPTKIVKKNILILAVKASCIAQELSMRKLEILKSINKQGDGAYIQDIRFIIK